MMVDDDWEVISKEERYPTEIDINMAFERLILKDYIQSNSNGSIRSNLNESDQEKSCLLAPAYLIDMGFVVVDQTAQMSIPLRNYGYEKTKIKIKKDDKKRKVTRTCFYVQLEQNIEICQCESSILNVIFVPKKDNFPQTRTDVSHKFYLEVRSN